MNSTSFVGVGKHNKILLNPHLIVLKLFIFRFTILSELMVEYPHVLQAEDYQSMLKLLFDFQPSIQHSLHMKCFSRIVDAMLSKEKELMASSTQIKATYCTNLWHKIMELSFKQAATDKTQQDNLNLMCIMIKNGVIVSFDFIKKIINDVTEMFNIKKSNSSINLLISILRNVDTDRIEDIKNLKIAIIKWLRPQVKLKDIKNVIGNNNVFDQNLVSDLYVLCVLSQQSDTVSQSYKPAALENETEMDEHSSFVSDAVEILQYRMLSKLIVTDTLQAKESGGKPMIEKLPARNEVKASVDDALFGELDQAIQDNVENASEHSSRNESSQESLTNISTSLATNVAILNSLVGYESIDADVFCKFMTKRVFLKISQLNAIIENIGDRVNISRSPNDVNEVLENLLAVWHDKYHPVIAENIFIIKSSSSIIKWLKAQLKSSRRDESAVMSPLKMANELDFEERIQLKCLILLTHFSAFEDENDGDNDDVPQVFKAIQQFKFNYKRNQDLFILFQLIKVKSGNSFA